jgi:hypothetical protein
MRLGNRQTPGITPVADHGRNSDRESGFQQGREITTPSGDEHDDIHYSTRIRPRYPAGAPAMCEISDGVFT